MAAAYSLDIDLREVLSNNSRTPDKVNSLRKAFSSLGKDGGDAMTILGDKIKNAVLATTALVKPLRLIVWLFDLLGKMNPFKMNPFKLFGSAYDRIVKIYDKLRGLSERSAEREQDARGTRTSPKNIRLFEQSFGIMGWDRSILKDITNAVDGGALDALAAVGIDAEKIKKLDGVEQLFAIYDGVEKFAKNMGGYDSVAIKPIMELMEKISPIFSAQNMRGNQGIFKERKSYYRELQIKDRGDDAAMTAFEKAHGELYDSFNNLWNLIASKLLPTFTRLTNQIKKFIDGLVEFLAGNPFQIFKENFLNLFDGISERLGFKKMLDFGEAAKNFVSQGMDKVVSKVESLQGGSKDNKKEIFSRRGAETISKARDTYGKIYNIDKNTETRILKIFHAAVENLPSSEKMKAKLDISVNSKGELVLDITDGSSTNRKLIRQQVIQRRAK